MKMIAGLLLLAASSQQGLTPFQLFNECRPMQVIVEGLPSDAAAIGLTQERVSTPAESRLRAARLFSDDPLLPYLYVNVNVFRRAFSVNVGFYKRLFDPVSGEIGFARTWNAGSTGTHGGDGGYIVQSLSEHLDRFVLEYLRVNEDACR